MATDDRRKADYTLTPDRERFPWLPDVFDMRNYAGLEDLDWDQWWQLLNRRRWVWRQYFPTKAGLRLVGKGPIVAMIENPLRTVDGCITKLERPTVRRMTLGDAEDLIGAIRTSLQWRDGEADTEPLPLLGHHDSVFIINTKAPRSAIFKELEAYLDNVERKRRTDKPDAYFRLGILPFLDLYIWCAVGHDRQGDGTDWGDTPHGFNVREVETTSEIVNVTNVLRVIGIYGPKEKTMDRVAEPHKRAIEDVLKCDDRTWAEAATPNQIHNAIHGL